MADLALAKDGSFSFVGWGMDSRGRWDCTSPNGLEPTHIELAFASDQAIWREALLPIAEADGYSTGNAYLTSSSYDAPAAAFLIEELDDALRIGVLGYLLYRELPANLAEAL